MDNDERVISHNQNYEHKNENDIIFTEKNQREMQRFDVSKFRLLRGDTGNEIV